MALKLYLIAYRNLELILLKLDFKKIDDTINLKFLFHSMLKLGIQETLVEMV